MGPNASASRVFAIKLCEFAGPAEWANFRNICRLGVRMVNDENLIPVENDPWEWYLMRIDEYGQFFYDNYTSPGFATRDELWSEPVSEKDVVLACMVYRRTKTGQTFSMVHREVDGTQVPHEPQGKFGYFIEDFVSFRE